MNRITTVLAVGALTFIPAFASAQTAGQRLDETVNSGKATSSRVWHRVTEQACTGTRDECERQKAANEASEARQDAANKKKERLDRSE